MNVSNLTDLMLISIFIFFVHFDSGLQGTPCIYCFEACWNTLEPNCIIATNKNSCCFCTHIYIYKIMIIIVSWVLAPTYTITRLWKFWPGFQLPTQWDQIDYRRRNSFVVVCCCLLFVVAAVCSFVVASCWTRGYTERTWAQLLLPAKDVVCPAFQCVFFWLIRPKPLVCVS